MINDNEVQSQKLVQTFPLYLNELGTEIFLWMGAIVYNLQPTESMKLLKTLIEYFWKGVPCKKISI